MKQKILIALAVVFLSVSVGFAMHSAQTKPMTTEVSNPRSRTFVKTGYRCGNGNCSCSGYWGYKHYNGTFEGNCSNSDGHGHTCGHGPEKHGLRRW